MVAYTNYRRDPRVRREAEALVGAGHRVVFLSSAQRGEPIRERLAGVDVRKLWGIGNRRTSASGYVVDYLVFFVLAMLHQLRHPLRYDLIHVDNMPDFLVFTAWLPRLLGRPVIHDVHDLMPELYGEKWGTSGRHAVVRLLRTQERWAGRFASAVLTVEDRLKEILAGRGIPGRKIHVLMNLPDERIFAPRAPPALRPPDAPFVMVYHGTLARRLGLDIAIRALALLEAREGRTGIELRIIGAGEEREPLVALSRELGLSATVRFSNGFVPVERIPEMIGDADVGLVPLRISAGTDVMLPTKLLEYVSMGIPCIAPRTSAIGRYFDDGMLQFFEAGNVSSLADAIAELRRNPVRRAQIAARATENFAAAHRWSEHKMIYIDLVQRLLEGNPRIGRVEPAHRAASLPPKPAERSPDIRIRGS